MNRCLTSICAFACLPAILVAPRPAQGAADEIVHAPYVLAEGEGPLNGRTGHLKAHGFSTEGDFAVVVRGPQNTAGPEAHTHAHMVEAWYVVEGALKFQSREHVFDAPAGSFVLVPPAVEHRFWSEPGQMVKVVQIFSPPGFEKFFEERYKLPGYDPEKTQAQQSEEWKDADIELATKYGGGPAAAVSNDIPVVIAPASNPGERWLAKVADTGGHYTLQESTIAPDHKPKRAQVSAVDQAWLVLEGQLEFHVLQAPGEWREVRAKSGDFVFVPRNTMLGYWRDGKQPVKFLHWRSHLAEASRH